VPSTYIDLAMLQQKNSSARLLQHDQQEIYIMDRQTLSKLWVKMTTLNYIPSLLLNKQINGCNSSFKEWGNWNATKINCSASMPYWLFVSSNWSQKRVENKNHVKNSDYRNLILGICSLSWKNLYQSSTKNMFKSE